MSRPKNAILFMNGLLAVFDERGEQMPQYQGKGTEMIPRLLEDHPDVNLFGATHAGDVGARA